MSPRPDGLPPQAALLPPSASSQTFGEPPTGATGLLKAVVWCAVLAVAVVLAVGAYQFSQGRKLAYDKAAMLTGGDPAAGRVALKTFSCGGCHTIPGVPGAAGLVGPPLTKFGLRVSIAGKYPNTPDNLRLWLRFPQAMDPGVYMPNTGATERQSRDMAAYLYTLK
jgi:cytochrome c1